MKNKWSDQLHSGAKFPMRIHLIGVAGSGMSGLASLLLSLGHRVSGSDKVSTKETDRLERVGLSFHCPHVPEVIEESELVIFSSAIKPGNVVYDASIEAGIPMLRRAEALVSIMSKKESIVIAGTHGKTTTSALAAKVLQSGELNPSHYVGAEVPVLGNNAHWSEEGDHFIAEGDESDGSLIQFDPDYAVLLNVEEDHLDHYTDGINGIRNVFNQFLDSAQKKIIYCSDDLESSSLCGSRSNVISYGWKSSDDFSAKVCEMREGSTDFDVFVYGKLMGRVTLGVPGKHNVLNGLGVIALATELGVDFSDISNAMREFRGAKRRFDVLYRSANYSVVDDYGHHPTEIKATIATAKQLNPERLVCVFQPHRYTRTQLMLDEFAKAFRDVDEVFVTDIYPAGEKPIDDINCEAVVRAIREDGHQNVYSVPDLTTAHLHIGAALSCGDTILTLGAGNIHEVGTALARDLETLDKLRRELDDPQTKCRLYEPMSRHTTIKIGGPAQYWIEPVSIEAFAKSLKFFFNRGIQVRVVGRGSNLLICDGGIPGAVIRPSGGEFEEVRVSENVVTAGVGARYKKVSNIAKANGISGFEWMEGIPGNVGGGLRMNAGAMGFETFDQVLTIKYLDSEGELHEKMVEEFESKYRNVPQLNENYAVSAVLKGTKDDVKVIDSRIRESMEKRKRTQPIAASAGCIFKNPIDVSAGQLIEELGLKNTKVGAARVSDVHGNFIVNDGGATAEDVMNLIEEIKLKAKGKRSIDLETEVQIIGKKKLKF